MNRRQILKIAACSIVLPLSGCFTKRLHQNTSYWEKVGGVFISSDKKTLAIIGNRYHYLIDAPAAILAALDPALRSTITSADFHSFAVNGANELTGEVTLRANGQFTENQKQLALAAGFVITSPTNMTATVPIKGTRYLAKPLERISEEKLNREYFVLINELPSIAEQGLRIAATPISIAADGAVTIGIIALSPIWIPLLLISVKSILK